MPQVEDPLESLFGGKKTTKCFRFPANAVRELESEAKGKAISLNSLMNTLIMTYLKWGRFVDRNGGLSFYEMSFSALINAIDDVSVFEKAGSEAGSKTPRRLLLMLGLHPTKEVVLRLVDMICEHSISYGYVHKVIDGKHNILLTHNLGMKWSKWFGSYLRSMFKDLLDLNIQVREDDDSVSCIV